MSTTTRLTEALDSVVSNLGALINELPIEYVNNDGAMFRVVAPNYRWGARTAEQQHQQLRIARDYKVITELLRVLMGGAPKTLTNELARADKQFSAWIELGSNWSIRPSRPHNENALRESAANLRKVIEMFAAGTTAQLILIPDTNQLLREQDPVAYRSIVGVSSAFEFVLLPTVLGELDELKTLHRVPEVREKAQNMITRIKGWRKQGSLSSGVIVDKTITVRAVHEEPDVEKSLSWLDPQNNDDRIIASVFRVQTTLPSARIILVTGDINLQNKADAALVETAEV